MFEVNWQNYNGYTDLLEIWKEVTFYPLFNLKQKKKLLDFIGDKKEYWKY